MNKEMTAFFNNKAPFWNNNPHEFDIRENIITMAKIPANSIIADIACGKGVMLPHLLKTNPSQIFAIDISNEMIKFAQEQINDDRISFINDDYLKASLPSLDTAIIFNAYPHFLDKPKLAEKLAKDVKQNGIVIIAHSRSSKQINETHSRNCSNLSAPLESAETEAHKFQNYFFAESIIDNDEIYFIKLRRG